MAQATAASAMKKVKTPEDFNKLINSYKTRLAQEREEGNYDTALLCLEVIEECSELWKSGGGIILQESEDWLEETRDGIMAEKGQALVEAEVEAAGGAEAGTSGLKRKSAGEGRDDLSNEGEGGDEVEEEEDRPPKRQRPERDVEEMIKLLALRPEGPTEEGALNWRQVLDQLDQEEVDSVHNIQYLVKLFEFHGFNAGKLAMSVMKKAPSGHFKKTVGDVQVPSKTMDILAMVIIGMSRGAKVEKIRKGLSDAGLTAVNALVDAYGIVSNTREPLVVTFPRMVACFPSVAMDIAARMTLGPVSHLTMSGIVPGYPRPLMCAGFPSLIPTRTPEYADLLLMAYLVFQIEVSLVINPDFKKLSHEEQKKTVEGFARAAMQSTYCSEDQRVRQMLKHGLVKITRFGLEAPGGAVGRALLDAATAYRRY